MYDAGFSGNEIVSKLAIPRTTIYNVLKRFRDRGTIKSSKRSGRPRKLTDRDLRELGRLIKNRQKLKASEIRNSIVQDVSTRTIRRRAHELGFYARVAAKKPNSANEQKKRRLTFACEHCHWTIEDWMKVIWTNESSFEIGKDSQQVMVWRNP